MTEATSVYDRFTELAKRALAASREAAASLGNDYIGTEHQLIGLAETAGTAGEILRAHGAGPAELRTETARQFEAYVRAHGAPAPPGQAAADALSSLGIDVVGIQRRAEETFGPGALKYPRAYYSGRAKMVLQSSFRQARELGKQQVDTEHLLLGHTGDPGQCHPGAGLLARGYPGAAPVRARPRDIAGPSKRPPPDSPQGTYMSNHGP
jgi:ATP-dependent Clp protease ATP-binding subunit ClpA